MIVIFCKGCGAPFYAVSTITDDDVLEIVGYAAQGHLVTRTNRATVQGCRCGGGEGKSLQPGQGPMQLNGEKVA